MILVVVNHGVTTVNCNLQVGRHNACGYFQWYDPPVPDHMKRAFARLINRATEAENERDKAKAKSKKLMWIIVVLLITVLICLICNRV